MSHVISQVEAPTEKTIDREKSCPLLLRIFCTSGRHHQPSDFARGQSPANELQIYTWMNCTLRELTSLIKDVNPDARRRGTEFNFSIVAPDRYSARYSMRDIGTTMVGQRGPDDLKTLAQCKFEVGDFIDVAINFPQPGNIGNSGGSMRHNVNGNFGGNHNSGGGGAPTRRVSGIGGRMSGGTNRYRD